MSRLLRKTLATVAGVAIVGLLAAWGAPGALAIGDGCVPSCSRYDPGTQPTCTNWTVEWTDGCGGTCSRSLLWGSCNAPAPTTCEQVTRGTQTSRTGGCTRSCTRKGPDCDPPEASSPYRPYGFAVPGDPTYGFSQVASFVSKYKTPETNDLVGLSAKGNIIIGDYTSGGFNTYVKPKLQSGGAESLVQPYAVDPSDASLGYDNTPPAACGGRSPCFNGHYTDRDGGKYTDGTAGRKFYESSLPAAQFKALIDTNDELYRYGNSARIDAVLYTNHAIAGYVPPKNNKKKLSIDGTMVGRDDAMVVDADFTINHDMRLNMASSDLGLPVAVTRPRLVRWEECSTGSPCQ